MNAYSSEFHLNSSLLIIALLSSVWILAQCMSIHFVYVYIWMILRPTCLWLWKLWLYAILLTLNMFTCLSIKRFAPKNIREFQSLPSLFWNNSIESINNVHCFRMNIGICDRMEFKSPPSVILTFKMFLFRFFIFFWQKCIRAEL